VTKQIRAHPLSAVSRTKENNLGSIVKNRKFMVEKKKVE
jgi:hypothetical protein